ncbi:uncharacterized protein LOC144829004 isoform X1 [Lissotriton helveticus]
MSSSSKSEDGAKPHPKKEFRCTVCRVTCLSEISYQAHIRGAKHLKAMKSVRSFGGRDSQIPPAKKLTSLKDYINDPDRDEPLIGLKYVEEGKKIKGKRHYRCTLCEHDMAMQIMFDHLIGHKHRRSYLNRHFPLLIKGVQAPTVAVIKKLAKEVEEEEGIQTYATNVNIKLKPQTSKKKPSEKSSEQSSLETNPSEPMQTNADDFIENLSNQINEVAQNPVVETQPPSFQGTGNDYRTSTDRASQYKSHESKTKYSSSRDSEYQSKQYKDQSSSQYQAGGYAKSAGDNRSSKGYESGSRHSSTGYSKDYDKSSRTYDSGSSQSGSGYSKGYDRSAVAYGSSTSQSSSGYNKDYDRSARSYDSGNNQPGSGYSKGYEGSARTYDSGTQQQTYGYNKDQESSRTYESRSSLPSSAYNKGFGESPTTYNSSSLQSSSGYNKDYGMSARTYEPASHSASGYDPGYDQRQASSAVQSTQQTMPPSTATAANPGGLSPDILKILQGKDVPTVTSILSKLAQYYPPLQNVDISLLVSVLFESGALK